MEIGDLYVKKIIEEYRPHKNFFDLSKKPSTLSDEEYAKILSMQNQLAFDNERFSDKSFRKNNQLAWEQLKVLSAQLQEIIFQHWDLSDLD